MIIVIAPWYFKLINKITGRNYIGQALIVVVVVDSVKTITPETINHERIHIRQFMELLILGFLFLYLWYMIAGYFKYKDWVAAYRNNPFETEAYEFESDLSYLKNRKWYNWRRYI